MTEEAPAIELAVSELRRGVDVGLANVEGQIALLYQQNAHYERRADEHARLIAELDDRLTTDERQQVTHDQLDTRFRHVIALLGLIAAAASVMVSAVIGLLGH